MKKFTLFLSLLIFPLTANAQFSDTQNHPYQEAIQYAEENGIVNGYSGGSFKPDNQINRAEFTKIIIDGTYPGILESASCDPSLLDYSDLDLSQWYAPYICIANQKNIIDGYPDGTFKPEQNINLAEALKIIYKAKKITLDEEAAKGEWYEPFFTRLNLDSSAENPFFNQVEPSHLLTRGESAFILDLVMAAYADQLFWPAEGEITEHFREEYYAIDISNHNRSLIYAANDGEVIKAASGWNGGYGKMVIIDHGAALKTLYAHLSTINTKEGDLVKKGEILGKMGDTGRTTEVKLHFEVIQDEEKKDPLDYLQ
jgi:murein DD-endopeptidase MepM/ murein hydrolase activator NlpD